MIMRQDKVLEFYKDKKVFVTGHTGFKGTWLCNMLLMLGAQVTGYGLEPPTSPSIFQLCGLEKRMNSIIGDIRDLSFLKKALAEVQPDIVIHMAAQPIVRDSYQRPVYTYEVNVMGTVNILEGVRETESVRSFLNVTTDKVYLNKEWEWGYRENEELNGFDPYSNSKSCSELVTSGYKNSFFNSKEVAISTARAGNVIGGGDFAADRIIPDCVRAIMKDEPIIIRNPNSTRPYQHVLEPLYAYLLICASQYSNPELAGNYNVGPMDVDCITTGELVQSFCKKWNAVSSEHVSWECKQMDGPHEANFLKLDCSKIRKELGWQPKWGVETALEKIVEWTKAYINDEDVYLIMEKQIRSFIVES